MDKYQYSMSLKRVVDRFKDVDAEFFELSTPIYPGIG